MVDSTAYRTVRKTVERQIGATLDFADLPPNEQALKAGRPVVRIVTLPGPGMVPQGFATGFLVAPDLILTNQRVFRASDESRGVGAQFLYERAQGGLREGVIFELDPDRFFLNHRGLDYALVAVKSTAIGGAPLAQFQFLPLIATTGKIRKGDPVNIIQHPEGKHKQYATVNNRLLDLRDDGFLLYETDTLEGASGSPVFSEHWETIGLHHCGVPLIENGMLVTTDQRRVPLDAEVADSDLIWIANEGVRVSALVASLRDQLMDKPEQSRILADLDDPVLPLFAGHEPESATAGVGCQQRRLQHGGTRIHQDPEGVRGRGLALGSARGPGSARSPDRGCGFLCSRQEIDRGHIVRREDSAWGSSSKEAEFSNSDTYHWTNCTPQSEAFNQSGKSGIWGKFEEHIQAEVQAVGHRMNVFAGPVLNPDDPEHGYDHGATIQVPMEFWKVVTCVAQEDGKRVKLAYGFVFDQTEPVQRLGYERMDMNDYEIYQVPIAEITKKTGIVFDPEVMAADVLKKPNGGPESRRGARRKRIQSLAGIVLR